MSDSPALQVAVAIAGLLISPPLLYLAPRLVAYRLDEPPEMPDLRLLVPLMGGRLARWQEKRTVVFEVMVAATFVALSVVYGAHIRLPLAACFSALLLLIAYIDLEHRLVLNRLSYPGVVLALGVSSFWPGLGLQSAALGALIGLAIFAVLQILGRGALGMGDTKLAVLIGGMRGIPTVLDALFYGVVLGGVGAVVYLLVLRRGRKEYMPYGPYLAVGAILSFILNAP